MNAFSDPSIMMPSVFDETGQRWVFLPKLKIMEQKRMSDESYLWGNDLLPLVLEAIGGFDREVSGLVLHFEYGQLATVDIEFDRDSHAVETLHLFGTGDISEFLGAPKGLQAVTMTVRKGEFAICECRYVPLALQVEKFTESLGALSA